MFALKIIHELIDEFRYAYFSQIPMRFIADKTHGKYIA